MTLLQPWDFFKGVCDRQERGGQFAYTTKVDKIVISGLVHDGVKDKDTCEYMVYPVLHRVELRHSKHQGDVASNVAEQCVLQDGNLPLHATEDEVQAKYTAPEVPGGDFTFGTMIEARATQYLMR